MGLSQSAFTKIVAKAKTAGLTGLALTLIVVLALAIGFGLFALGVLVFQYCWNYLASGSPVPVLTFWQAAALKIVASHLFHSTTTVELPKKED